jgi:hypothetical protein
MWRFSTLPSSVLSIPAVHSSSYMSAMQQREWPAQLGLTIVRKVNGVEVKG